MYNIVLYQELESAGVPTRTIRQALRCCLLKLCSGVYSVIAECGLTAHHRIASFIDDRGWTELHEKTPIDELREDYSYLDLLRCLRIRYYPRYREDDTIWGASAAMLHGIPLFGIDSGPVSVAHPRHYSKTSEVHRSTRSVAEEDCSHQAQLRLTTPIRTSLDLVGLRGQRAGFAAMEFVLRKMVLNQLGSPNLRFGYPPEIDRLARGQIVDNWMPAIKRLRTGQATARRMADALDPKSESIAESYCSFNLHALNLRGLQQQVKIYDERGFVSRNDFMDKETMTILEVDGVDKYVKVGRGLMNKESDQHNRLLALGFTVVRFKFKELLNLSTFSAKLFAQAPKLRQLVRVAR